MENILENELARRMGYMFSERKATQICVFFQRSSSPSATQKLSSLAPTKVAFEKNLFVCSSAVYSLLSNFSAILRLTLLRWEKK
jgi:hypothetical protein